MHKIFSENLGWKITSLVLAAILWLFVINTQNPIQPQEIKNISVMVKGIKEVQEKGYVLKNLEDIRNQKVRVIVRGPRLQTDKIIANPSLLTVSINLTKYASDLSTDTVQSVAKYEATSAIEGINIVGIRPETTDIIFEREQSTVKRVQYKLIGNTDSRYMALDPIITPQMVELKGAKSDIESISKVVAEINIEKFSGDILVDTVPLKVYDKNGEELLSVLKVPEQVEIRLPIGKKKVVPLEPSFTGKLPNGYTQKNVIVMPKTVTIVGKSNKVDAMQSIKLKPISLNNIKETTGIETEMILPTGIDYLDKKDNKVTVTIEITKQDKYTYTLLMSELAVEVIGLDDNLEYEINTHAVPLTLSATAEELIAFDSSSIKSVIDLTNLQEGMHQVPLVISVPEPFKVIDQPIKIEVSLTPKQ